MIYLHAYSLAFLEVTFILVMIMLFHCLKQSIGNAAFYLALGAIIVVVQLVTASELRIMAYPTVPEATMGPVLLAPFMAALLITYIVDGTTEAQRLMFGVVVVVGIFVYLSFLSQYQFFFPGFAESPNFPPMFMEVLYGSSRFYMVAALLSIFVEFLVLPVIYQLLRNYNFNLTVSVFGALISAQVLDSFFFQLLTNFRGEDWWLTLGHSYMFRALATIWVAALTNVYLHLRQVPKKSRQKRSPWDIVTAIFGSYGQTRLLQVNLREWEGRYRMVVENANDLIFIVAHSGIILDANRSAAEKLGYSIDGLHSLDVQSIMHTGGNGNSDWRNIWNDLFPRSRKVSAAAPGTNVSFHEMQMKTQSGNDLVLDATFTPLLIQGNRSALLVARDITQRRQLEQEREELREHLINAQRMEAVGKLAGGIAHDFNNLLHAIQGSLDLLDSKVEQRSQAKQLVSNIAVATDRAGRLTGQLLGFARGGKYQVVNINIADLIRQTESLFRPMAGKRTDLKVVVHPDPMNVEGDFTQLEQVLLNILLNAMDALLDSQGKIIVRAEPANEFTMGWRKDDPTRNPAKYVVIRIRDTGTGIDRETMNHIFDPFFTTKSTKGTGMGLAMAYGCIENHNGWIHVESSVGKGTEFFVYLPII